MKKRLQTVFNTRQYMVSRDFELYYYSDIQISSVKSHFHNYYEFYFFLEGDVEICIDGKTYPVSFGDVILIPPGIYHYPVFHNSQVPYRRFVLWISQDYCNQLVGQCTDYGYLMQAVAINKNYIFHMELIEFNSISSMIFRLIEEIRSDRFGKKAEMVLELNALILHLNRIVYQRNNKKNPQIEGALYLNLCDFIAEHLEEDLSLDRLAGEFFVSKYYISHVFKNNMGISIHQYITKKRLQTCRDGILTENAISKVYQQYGFADYSSFYRAFKKEYGVSPKDYRDMYRSLEGEMKKEEGDGYETFISGR